jgi:hypothetical protein
MEWADLLPSVLPSTPGCSDILAIDHIRKAAREFCARTLCWQYQANAITAQAEVATYTLQMGDGQELVKLLACEVNGTEYHVPNGAAGRRLARQGVSNLCTMASGGQDFTLSPTPSAGVSIVTDIAVKPSMTSATWLDDFAAHTEAVAAGAIASLCALPKKPWTDHGLAALQREMFENRIGTEQYRVFKGMGRSHSTASVEWC